MIAQRIRPSSKSNSVTIFASLPEQQNKQNTSRAVKSPYDALMIFSFFVLFLFYSQSLACIRDRNKQPLGRCASLNIGFKAMHASVLSNQSGLHNADFTLSLVGRVQNHEQVISEESSTVGADFSARHEQLELLNYNILLPANYHTTDQTGSS